MSKNETQSTTMDVQSRKKIHEFLSILVPLSLVLGTIAGVLVLVNTYLKFVEVEGRLDEANAAAHARNEEIANLNSQLASLEIDLAAAKDAIDAFDPRSLAKEALVLTIIRGDNVPAQDGRIVFGCNTGSITVEKLLESIPDGYNLLRITPVWSQPGRNCDTELYTGVLFPSLK